MADCESCVQDYSLCGDCHQGSLFKGITNADRIRYMSDEELAELLATRISGCQTCIHRYVVCVSEDFDCVDGVLQWLKSEVKE